MTEEYLAMAVDNYLIRNVVELCDKTHLDPVDKNFDQQDDDRILQENAHLFRLPVVGLHDAYQHEHEQQNVLKPFTYISARHLEEVVGRKALEDSAL